MSEHVTPSVRILIVDDHAIVRAGLRMLIDSQVGLQVVQDVATSRDALSVVNREHIDIILLDLDLAGESGVDLLPELQRVAPHARVIILTGSQDAAMHQRAVQRGAKGVILKSEASDVLHRAIQEVLAGGIWLDSALTARMLSGTLTTPEANPEEAKIASLTLREREVITLIGQGLTNKEIAQRLSVSATTVNHHLTTIYAKLKVPNRLDLAVYAYRHGLTQTPR